jgi:Tfp pilus assembly protein PilF
MKSLISAIAVVGLALFSLGCSKQINFLKARNELNKGVRSFTAADYAGASNHFQTALELDPTLTDAKSYQAYSYMMQYIPGAESPENDAMAQKAIEGFNNVLSSDPENELAVSALASLYFNMKKFDEAEEWHRKRIAMLEMSASKNEGGKIKPEAADSYYTIGVIKWTQSYEPRLQARADLGMRPEDPGPIKDAAKRQEMAEKLVPIIEEGLQALNNALKINPNYADAMAYLNLLNREHADFAESQEEYEEYLAKADEWVQKTLDTKKRIAEESTIDQFHAE